MAEQASFIGSVQHTPDTIQRLYKTEYYTYDTLRILSRFLFGGALIAAALILELPRPVQILLLLAGCWLIISKDFPAAVRADQVLDNRKAALPLHICSFFEDRVELSGEGSMKLAYPKFQRLIVEKDGVEGGSPEELKAFVARLTGLSWQRNRSLLTMNLADLRQALRDRRAR